MKRKNVRSILIVGCLVAATCAAMGYAGKTEPVAAPPVSVHSSKAGVVAFSGNLVQDKVLKGGDGITSLSLTLAADEAAVTEEKVFSHVDMMIVLDRSGSMDGAKIRDAKRAVHNLVSSLSPEDRLGLITYSDDVRVDADLVEMTSDSSERLRKIVDGLASGGSTNLGAGLQQGIQSLLSSKATGNMRKVILISDGLANRGVTSTTALGQMASAAAEKGFPVSTVGVGVDFNEHLMTAIADRGAGSYYYLETPGAFAEVFQKELHNTRAVVATSVEIRIPLQDGIELRDAAGYPIEMVGSEAVIRPGDLLSGQSRKLFLSLKVPTGQERSYAISSIRLRYQYEGQPFQCALDEPFRIACVKDRKDVLSSIDRDRWEEKVLKEDQNRLREDVAKDIEDGNKAQAMERIQEYYDEKSVVNAAVGSEKVAASLDGELEELRQTVSDTFVGSPQEVQLKQKTRSKQLQYEGYQGRRSKKGQP